MTVQSAITYALAADPQPLLYSKAHDFQRECMLKFFFLLEYDHDLSDDVCEWEGVGCNAAKILTRVDLSKVDRFTHFCLEFVPSTVQYLLLAKKPICGPLHVQQLPRDLRHGHFQETKLTGTINLQVLPQKVITMQLQVNQLKGVVYIGDLPPSMRSLNLAGNPIRRVYVDNSRLPQHLEKVTFRPGRRGRKISILSVDGGEVDSRVHFNPYPLKM